MSRLTNTLMNAVPRLVLASPLHRLMSSRYATLHFTGRKSARRYHLPVAYITDGDEVVISTDSGWWRNIAHGEAFSVTFQGRRHHATAASVEGRDAVDFLRQLVELPGYAKTAGIPRSDGHVTEGGLVRAASERVVLAIELGGSA